METRIFRLQCKTDEAPPEFLRATLKQCLEIYHPKGCLAVVYELNTVFFFRFSKFKFETRDFFFTLILW